MVHFKDETVTILNLLFVLTMVFGAPVEKSSKQKRDMHMVLDMQSHGCFLHGIPQLTREQKDGISNQSNQIERIQNNPNLLWSSEVEPVSLIINEDQKQQILAHYRGLFRDVSGGLLSNTGRRKRDAQVVCPAEPFQIVPRFAINSDGNVVQVVQFSDANQVVVEERCQFEESSIVTQERVKCQQRRTKRTVEAVVIDLATRTFEKQFIGVKDCIATRDI